MSEAPLKIRNLRGKQAFGVTLDSVSVLLRHCIILGQGCTLNIYDNLVSFYLSRFRYSSITFMMTSTDAPPPPYATSFSSKDYEKEVERLMKKAAEDPAFKQNVKEKFIEASGSEENLKKIAEGVDTFTENLSKINAAFDDIRVKLYEIDVKGLKDRKGNTWKGEPMWEDLRSKWKALLAESQSTALKSVARCEEFQLFCDGVQKIETIDDQQFKDTIIELEYFIEAKGPDGREYNPKDVEEEAKKHSKAFSDLKDKLANFKAEFDDFAEYQKTKLDADISDLNDKIAAIEREIAFDSSMISKLGVALGVTVFATLAGGVILAGLGPLSILAIIGLVIGALFALGEAAALAYFVEDWKSKTAQRDVWKSEVRGKEALKNELEAVMSKLANQNDGLGFIITQVDLLKNVWLTISNEAYLIVDMLKRAKDMSTLTYYKDQIKNAKKAYEELTRSLDKYARAG